MKNKKLDQQNKFTFFSLLIFLDNIFKKLIFLANILLIIWLIVGFFQMRNLSEVNMVDTLFEQDYLLEIWKYCRNILYLALLLDLLLVLIIFIKKLFNRKILSAFKQILLWISILLFTTFSFAVASLLIRIVQAFLSFR